MFKTLGTVHPTPQHHTPGDWNFNDFNS